jgi:hypothetical protein
LPEGLPVSSSEDSSDALPSTLLATELSMADQTSRNGGAH